MTDDKEIVLTEKRYQSLLADLHKLINEGRTKAQNAMNRDCLLYTSRCV